MNKKVWETSPRAVKRYFRINEANNVSFCESNIESEGVLAPHSETC